MIPIHLQMQIDLMAADAKRAIAEGFAAARAKLLPEPAPDPWLVQMLRAQQALAADPRGNWAQYNNAATSGNVGMLDAQRMTWDEWNGCHLMGVDAYSVAKMLGMQLPR